MQVEEVKTPEEIELLEEITKFTDSYNEKKKYSDEQQELYKFINVIIYNSFRIKLTLLTEINLIS